MGRVFHLLLLIVIIVFSQIASGQDYGTQAPVEYSDRPAQYILGSDVLLITVNLWGHVQKPGIYSIPSAFGIVDLLGERSDAFMLFLGGIRNGKAFEMLFFFAVV